MTDPRMQALVRGIGQLTEDEIETILATPMMLYDGGNYDPATGKFCPLAVALGVPTIVGDRPTSNAEVSAMIGDIGRRRNPSFVFNQLHGTPGNAYRDDRPGDLRRACAEILSERRGA